MLSKEWIRHKVRHNAFRVKDMLKWIFFSVIMGVALGFGGALFYNGIRFVSELRLTHPQFLFLLPVGAVLIVFAYRRIGGDAGGGTNLVLLAIQSDNKIPLRMAPLIFFSTILSHLAGASVGREGAALQMGGSVGGSFAELFRLNENDRKIMIMVGMSAAFSAMLGTPIAASVFSMEVVTVGIMQYSALMPCVIASYIARFTARAFGIPALKYDIGFTPAFELHDMLIVFGLALCCGVISVVFCAAMHGGESVCEKLLPNAYLRALVLGSVLLGLTVLSGGQTYNGTGADYIYTCVEGNGMSLGFLVKIVFTTVSILAGYKGGEIVPSFFIGASLGTTFGTLTGFDASLAAALGMAGVFCGVTNCPITSLLIFCELFGFEGAPYALLMCAVSYIVSGYYGLYTGQKIVFSKFRSNKIDKKTE